MYLNAHVSKRLAALPKSAIPERFGSAEAYARELGVNLDKDALDTSALKDYRELPDVLEVKSRPRDEQVAAWADLAQHKPQMGAIAFNEIQQSADSWGERLAGRLLRDRVVKGANREERSAALFGGLVPFQHLSQGEPTLPKVGKVAYDLLLGSQKQPENLQEIYIQSGLHSLYTLALSQGSIDFKTDLPLVKKEKDMEGLSQLLVLDPEFQGLPQKLTNGEPEQQGPPRVADKRFEPALPFMVEAKEQADDFAAFAGAFNDTEIDLAKDDPKKLVLKDLPFQARQEFAQEGRVDIQASFDNLGNIVQLEAKPGSDSKWDTYQLELQPDGSRFYQAQSEGRKTSFTEKGNIFHRGRPGS